MHEVQSQPEKRRFSSTARLWLIAALILPAACADLGQVGGPSGAGKSQLVPPAGPPLPPDPLETIARFERARTDGAGLLQMLLARGEEATRVRAAIALGRLPFPELGAEVTDALVSALDDESAQVRACAAFAIGMRADPKAAAALLAHWKDHSAEVRARIVEAASRIDDARCRQEVLYALHDADLAVRGEAALAPHRWIKPPDPTRKDQPTKDADEAAAVVDSALIAQTRAVSVPAGATASARIEPDAQVVWRALFSLQRRKSERAREAFEASLSAKDARERIFAAQGLASISAQPHSQDELRKALSDRDWRVVYEAALALGKHPDVDSGAALGALLAHASAHVRRGACEALGSFKAQAGELRPTVEHALLDASPNVRAAAIEALSKLQGDDVAALIDEQALDADPLVRAGVARAAANLSSERAVPLLVRLAHDTNLRVAGLAIESLGAHPTAAAHAELRALLEAHDNGLRLAAVEALGKQGTPEDIAPLRRCYETSTGEIASEIAFTTLRAVAGIGANGDGGPALEFLQHATTHREAYVRKVARELLAKHFPNAPAPRVTETPSKAASEAELDATRSWKRNPRAEITTTRGRMLFELFPGEVPEHVNSFIELAKRGHYDKLSFHRVVPDFVIQGGDPRGDGNGGAPWQAESLKAEFTARKTLRGSLGTPRNEDPDSGGSQIFVTQRETPHLDGRYTIFGELREGFDVLDSIEVGDMILNVRVIAGSPGE